MFVLTAPLHLLETEDLSSHAIESVVSTARRAYSDNRPAAQELLLLAAPLRLMGGHVLPLDALIRAPTILHSVVL